MFAGGCSTKVGEPYIIDLPYGQSIHNMQEFESAITQTSGGNTVLYKFELVNIKEHATAFPIFDSKKRARETDDMSFEELIVEPATKRPKIEESEEMKQAYLQLQLLKTELDDKNKAYAFASSQCAEHEKTITSQIMQIEKLTQEKETITRRLEAKRLENGETAPMDLDQEFLCAICQEIILGATTLQCSHSFCKECIRVWLKEKQMCPVCRKRMTQKPIKNVTLENIVEKYIHTVSPAEKESRLKRIEDQKRKEDQSLAHLHGLIETAKTKGVKFLSVNDNWNNDEKKVFKQGISYVTN